MSRKETDLEALRNEIDMAIELKLDILNEMAIDGSTQEQINAVGAEWDEKINRLKSKLLNYPM